MGSTTSSIGGVGIVTVVNVGVATFTTSTGTPVIEFIGTAAVTNGRVVSIAITNTGSILVCNPILLVWDMVHQHLMR